MQCRSIKTIFSVLVVFAVFALITGCEAQDSSGFQGKAPPEIKAEEWINSEPLSLASLTGKIVVVEFWATWCPPCRQSIPHLIELSKQFKDKNV
ncbi:TlpA family protein disulfide reductase, partial [bacterium]|nr:TlpA family protein disulfide reductase [bacterium]